MLGNNSVFSFFQPEHINHAYKRIKAKVQATCFCFLCLNKHLEKLRLHKDSQSCIKMQLISFGYYLYSPATFHPGEAISISSTKAEY